MAIGYEVGVFQEPPLGIIHLMKWVRVFVSKHHQRYHSLMKTIKPPIWRSLVSSAGFILSAAVYVFAGSFYFTDPQIAADVKGTPIFYVFILGLPGLIYLFLKMLNTLSAKLQSGDGQLMFSSLFSRVSVPLSEIQDITITSPDLIETNFSGPTPKPVIISRKPIQVFVGMPHVLNIVRNKGSESMRLEVGPGWRKEDLEAFVKGLRKS
jgi:hypothetical protein